MTIELDDEAIIKQAIEKVKDLIITKPLYAEVILNQLLRASPENPQGFSLLGVLKQRMKQFDESIILLEKAINLDPNNADNYNNIALNYANLDNYSNAILYLDKALEINPNSYLYINNLALQYRQIGKHDIALQLMDRALEISNAPEIWCNKGGVYGEIKDLSKSEECFLKAISINPEIAAAHVDLAFSYQLRGEWKKGFKEYEWRFKHFPQLKYYLNAYDQTKLWNGKDNLKNKTILLYGEQGLGDTIQFVRYCHFLKDRGAITIVHTPDVLESVIKRVHGVDKTVVKNIITPKEEDEPFPDYDYQCSLMSLPYLLGMDYIPELPYIQPIAKLELKDYKNTFNIGVSWMGSPAHPNDAARSTYLKYFKAIHDIPGIKLFNLQINSGKRIYASGKKIIDYSEGCEDMRVVDMTPMIQTFEDSATIISGLDLIISVDTALVHLAGAMNVPCWVLVPFNPDWRWCIEGDKTAWYESLELFRQPKPGDWGSVFNQVKERLELLIGEIE